MAQAHVHSPTLPPIEGTAAPEVGDMLGVYQLESVAGEGGMGRVFCATHVKLGKRVAVKVLRRRYSRNPESIVRFFQEARAVNVIRHPNIVEITDFLEGPPGGDSYYIMEWLEGTTLAERLTRDKVLPLEAVVSVGRQVASALAAVHKCGFVHRDLKPENIFLLERDGKLTAKILDFGVAMLQGPTDGAVAGTPAYFSPEGAAGRPVDGRSDVYSLGVMLYELVSGAPPFQASSLSEYVMKHMTAKPRPLQEVAARGLPPALVSIIDRCLEKSPVHRFQTMDDLELALAAVFSSTSGTHAKSYRVDRSKYRWARMALLALLVFVGSTLVARGLRALVAPAAPTPAKPMVKISPSPAPAGNDPAEPAAAAPAITPTPKETPRAADGVRMEVRLGSEPQGAEVYLDGALLGVTPCTVHLPPGRQSLKLTREGYRPTPFVVESRTGASYEAQLLALPAKQPKSTPPRRTPAKAPKPGATIDPFQ